MTEQASPPASPDEPAPPPPSTGTPNPDPGGDPATPSAWRPNYVFLAVTSIVTLAADLGTKEWARHRLDEGKSYAERHIEVIRDVFAFRFAQNKGGAFGLLQSEPESIRRPFFLGISVAAVAFIVWLYRSLTPQQRALKWGLPLVLGGALGNLVNRIQYNYVVDFIDFQWKGHHWPTFNVADIAIVVGVGLMAIDMFTPRKKLPLASPAARADAHRDPPPPAEPPAGDAGIQAPKET